MSPIVQNFQPTNLGLPQEIFTPLNIQYKNGGFSETQSILNTLLEIFSNQNQDKYTETFVPSLKDERYREGFNLSQFVGQQILKSFDKEQTYFNESSTGMPLYDSILDDKTVVAGGLTKKKYYELEKGMYGDIKKVSPDKYIDDVVDGFWKNSNTSAKKEYGNKKKFREVVLSHRQNTEILKKAINSGIKINMPVLEYADGQIFQEGLHRAIAAKELGINEIPVLYVNEHKRDY